MQCPTCRNSLFCDVRHSGHVSVANEKANPQKGEKNCCLQGSEYRKNSSNTLGMKINSIPLNTVNTEL